MDAYTILETLAEGGMGRVFLARRKDNGEYCVLKEIRAERVAEPTARKRFEREALITRELDHPNIARVLEAQLEGDKQWITFEYVRGCSLAELIRAANDRRERVPHGVAVLIALEVLKGLEHAHTQRDRHGEPLHIVHRDLTPANVMLSRAGEVKIIDFGVARGNVGDFKTAAGMLVGTIRYMSPEQAAGEALDQRSDLYTLAAVLYELLAGRPLITATDRIDVLEAIAFEAPASPAAIDPRIPAEVDQVIMTALAKEPARRYPSAKDLREALERAAGSLAQTPRAALVSWIHRTAPEIKALRSETLSTTVVRVLRAPIAYVRRWPAWQLLLLVALAMMMSFSAVFFMLVDRSAPVVMIAAPPQAERASPEIVPKKPIERPPPPSPPPPKIKDPPARAVRPAPSTKVIPAQVNKHEHLRRMLVRLKATPDPDDDALLELHDALHRSVRAVEDPALRRALELKLAAFARGGGIEALERALEELERSAP
jgi:tRNA A-37 threonylcarbamoyl transferase component Bud32